MAQWLAEESRRLPQMVLFPLVATKFLGKGRRTRAQRRTAFLRVDVMTVVQPSGLESLTISLVIRLDRHINMPSQAVHNPYSAYNAVFDACHNACG